MTPDIQKKEIATTVRWGAGIIVAIFIQSLGFAWYASQVVSEVNQNSRDIQELQTRTSVYINREQLDDLLGARDEKTANIEKSLIRIEGKLDRVIQ